MVDSLSAVLRGILGNPHELTVNIPVLGDSNLDTIWGWNSTVPEPTERFVHELVEEHALLRPDSEAINAWDGNLSYKQLDSLANRLASRLLEMGIRSGQLIPLCFEKSMWTSVGMLAVLKTGAAFVLLDSSLPLQRLQNICEQVESDILLSSQSNMDLSTSLGCKTVVQVSAETSRSLSESKSISKLQSRPRESVMFAVFTSGSTGVPKGALLTHTNFASALAHQKEALGLSNISRVFDFASYAFDMSVHNAFATLSTGGCLCVPSEHDRKSNLATVMREMRATVVDLTPSVARLLDPASLPDLKTIIFGGEALGVEDVKRFWGRGVRVANVYGPAETHVVTVNADAPTLESSTLLGKGCGVVLWVVDPRNRNRLMPPGLVGELVIEGHLVGQGYLRDFTKTAAAFVDDPIWLNKGSTSHQGRTSERKLYMSGDLVRYEEDGSLRYISRKDAQVKIRGQRVELGEVEHCILQCMPEATQVIAEVIKPYGAASNPMLVAFLQLGSETFDSFNSSTAAILHVSQEVRTKLAETLPTYMIPAVFLSMERLPKTASGKTNRLKLREIGGAFSARELGEIGGNSQQKKQPTTKLESEMQQVWSQVLCLDVEDIGLEDNFFQLGGDSIAAMKLAAESYKAGLRLAVADIFRSHSLSEVAQCATRRQPVANEEDATIAPFSLLEDLDVQAFVQNTMELLQLPQSTTISDAYPCTPLQQGLFSLSMKRSGDYMLQATLKLNQNVEIQKFQHAWEQVVTMFPILRTRIIDHDDWGLVQLVTDEKISWVQTACLEEYIKADRQEPIAVGSPLARYALVNAHEKSSERYFVWTVHHALYDGWSEPLIIRALNKIYEDLKVETGPQFPNFIKYIKDQDKAKVEHYWRGALGGHQATAFPSLPPSVREPVADASIEICLPRLTIQNTSITVSNLIRASWAVVVSQRTSTDDVIFGVTVSGRNAPIPGVEMMVGPTFATLPLRIKVPQDQDIQAFLKTVQDDATKMIPSEQLGLHEIAKLSPAAQQACAFQTLLVIQPEVEDTETVLGEWTDGDQYQWFNSYGLTLVVSIGSDNLTVKALFDTRIIEKWMVEKLVEHLDHVMQYLIESSNGLEGKTVGDIGAVTPTDLAQMWEQNQKAPVPAERCIHEIIQDQVRVQPGSPAVSAWDGDLTYLELDQLSTNMASHLLDLGVGAGVFVPLCFEKSLWATVAMLAMVKTGGSFVLLDPSLPKQRLQAIVEQVDARIILCSPKNQNLSAELCGEVIVTSDEFLEEIRQRRVSDELPSPALDSIIYVVFTSGTTGTPKGAIIHHRSSASAVLHQVKGFGYTRDTRLYDFSTYSFDGCILNAFTVLAAGGCLCVPTDDDRKTNLAKSLESLKANAIFLTPSVAELLSPEELPHMRSMILGGEAIRVKDIQPWWDSATANVFTIYGPSECTPVSMINPQPTTPEAALRLGWGAGQVTWIVNPNDHNSLAPFGSVGELLLEGPLVGQGYLNEPEKTAAAFIKSPDWLTQGLPGLYAGRSGRLYKTGDLAKFNDDGSISYMGRKDDQVKVRGQRVELGEVEHQAQLCFPEATQLAAEVFVPQSAEDEVKSILVLFVQLPEDYPISGVLATSTPVTVKILQPPAEVVDRLSESLPSYMIPTAFLSLQHLPMGTTGKMDRKRLRLIAGSISANELAQIRTAGAGPKREAKTNAEKRMQGIWAKVLGVDAHQIGMDDSFFQLGGDSISAMKLTGEVRKEGLTLTVADIFCHPRLQQVVSRATSESGGSNRAITRTDVDGPVEQSYAQGRLWFLEQLYPGLTWYLMPCIMRLKGSLNLDALNAAFFALEDRHETLRTTFSTENGVNLQHVHPPRTTHSVTVIDKSSDTTEDIEYVLLQDEVTPFDLSNEPAWRVKLYSISEDEHVLSILLNHIISDGWSIDILRQELASFYSLALRGQNPLSTVEPLPVQYRDFSVWQKEQGQIEEHARQLQYWMTELELSQPAELMCDKPRPVTLSGKADVEGFSLHGVLFERLQAFCKTRGVTPFIALLAAFKSTHFRLTGESDGLIGSPNANRDRFELRSLMGFFVNMQCLRVKIENESVTFADVVEHAQSAAIASLANQDVPFEQLVSKLRKDRDLSRHPLIQLVFAVHSQQDLGQFSLEGCDTEYIDQTITTRFDVEFHFFPEKDGLRGELIYSTDLFEAKTMQNFLSVFHTILETGISEPNTPVALLPLLDESKSIDVLAAQPLARYPRELSIAEVFREQAVISSDKTAVKDSSSSLTYKELDEESDKIARWLIRQSLAPETLVGVFSSRSSETIATLLGILKANLAYLPFDLKVPSSRMEGILSSIGGSRKLILTGSEVQLPSLKNKDVEFFKISDVLENSAGDEVAMPRPTADSLAYVMFTSGSTGKPKGVQIENRSILRLAKAQDMIQHNPSDTMAHMSNIAFDAATWEIYVTLLNGGTLVCLDHLTVLDHTATARIFIDEKIRALFITPALLKEYLTKCPTAISVLDTIYIGGDKLHPQDVFTARSLMQGGKIVNGYGPTENTTFSTFHCLQTDDKCVNGVAIGSAVTNSGAFVMDLEQRPVPRGVVGELVVTGDGLARGYLDARQNVNRFIDITVDGKKLRAYRTGDFVRHRPSDGQIEYLRRMDGQIKIRGQRVELGEIEHVIRDHGPVHDAVVTFQAIEGREAQLTSFVTLRESDIVKEVKALEEEANGEDETEQVNVWKESFDTDIYTGFDKIKPDQVGRDFVGWTSMYDGSDINKNEMSEWLDDTINSILNGGQAGNVLELGSGSGMIAFNLINHGLESYVGLDPSQKAVEFITRTAKSLPAATSRKIHMYKGTALDMHRLDEDIAPDLVVINSVAQYFPSIDYLCTVIERILLLPGARKTIFCGDMRSFAMYKEFHVTRSLSRLGKDPTKAEVRRYMSEMEQMEVEFLVDPAFFTSLQDRLPHLVSHVEILCKKMDATNELSCYRYAAVIHSQDPNVGSLQPIHKVEDSEWVDFEEGKLNEESLGHLLESSSSSIVAISNIPYSKTIFERQVLDALQQNGTEDDENENWLMGAESRAKARPASSSIELCRLAQSHGYRVEVSWARQYSQRGGLDAIFHHIDSESDGQRVMFRFPVEQLQKSTSRPLNSQPLRQQVKQRIREHLMESLRSQLPLYMVPRGINLLDNMPMNENGKVDRRALADIVHRQMPAQSTSAQQQPRTSEEQQLQLIWARVLNIEPRSISMDDSFFSIGGDSLAAMRLVGEANKIGFKLAVADIFRHPTIQDMAVQEGSTLTDAQKTIPRVETDEAVEQSFAQRRLWFMEQLYPNLNWYLVPSATRLRGRLQLDALNQAIGALERRHETLRTTFDSLGDVDVQLVHPYEEKALQVIDLKDEEELLQAVKRDHSTPFNLRTEPGWRVSVFRLDDSNHMLSICCHHIISDGWSVDVLQRELSTLYTAAIKGRDVLSELEPLPIQYKDFSVWQKLQVDEHERQLAYWVNQLETSQPAELFCDKHRPTTLSGRASTESLRIEGSLYGQLQTFCSSNGITPFVALLSIFRATHFLLTGSTDATMGTVNANRDRWEVRDLLGFFVNMQCLRIKVEDESLEQLVHQVNTTTIASFANQDVPFENIVSELHRDRDLSRHPLAQLVFALHSQMNLGQFKLEDLESETISVPPTTRFDLEFHFFQEENALQGEVLYSTDLFEPATIQNMLSIFKRVLEAGLASLKTAITSLPIFAEKDWEKLDNLGLAQVDQLPYPRDSSIVDIFHQQVSAFPDRVAVKDSTHQLTYTDLDEQSDALCKWLSQRCLAPESLVGVFSPRSTETVVALLGVLKAGLAYLPFDISIPQGRMEMILSSVKGHKVVLTGHGVHSPVSSRDDVEFVKIMDAINHGPASHISSESNAPIAPSAASLAYVMFTSGSTGQPKGALIEHRGIVRLVKGSNMASHLPSNPVMAHVTNTAFDVSGWEIYGALLNGGTLICISRMDLLDFRAMSDLFQNENIESAIFTPALLKQYLSECPAIIKPLKALYVAGDRADADDLALARGMMNGAVVNAYGPTENSVISTLYSLEQGEQCVNGVPIGRSISNSGAYVMDKQQRLVSLGMVGELVVTGDGLARGYTDPARNADRFVIITVGNHRVRAYRTGDYVRQRPTDGQMEFFGRMDGQVKIRGHRVELPEIEHAIRNHSSVNDAVVVLAHASEAEEAQIASFITVKEATLTDDKADDNDAKDIVNVWEELFDADTYSVIDKVRPETIGRDFLGWMSMYDGQEIDKEEMNEWLNESISAILNGGKPGNVLEIGTGSGMILFNLMEGLDSYIGLEPSENAVEFTAKAARSIPLLKDKVKVYKGTAADIHDIPGAVLPNLVIVNSVAQYFPTSAYLLKVVEDAAQLGSVETLFFGDIRSYALSRQFTASKVIHNVGDVETKDEFVQRMEHIERSETELLVDPAFFTALAARWPHIVSHVEILPKMMNASNELSRFRYAAVIHIKRQKGKQFQQIRDVGDDSWINFKTESLDKSSLSQLLGASTDTAVVPISNIPYKKTITERHVLDMLDHGQDTQDWIAAARQQAEACPSMSPLELADIAELNGFRLELSWARQFSQHGGLDAIFHRFQPEAGQNRTFFRFPTDHHNRASHSFTSRPLQLQLNQKVQRELYDRLQQLLPQYMIPQSMTVLDKMPINQNGKVDRSALTARVQVRKSTRVSSRQEPRTDMEQEMQRIWAHVLNVEKDTIGVEDSFFHLGGNSISAMRVVSEARKVGLQLTVGDVFRHDVLEELAVQCITSSDKDKGVEDVVLVDPARKSTVLKQVEAMYSESGAEVEDVVPLTSFQEKIVIDGERVGQHANYFYVDMGTSVDLKQMQESFWATLAIFPILRARFLNLDGDLWRIVFRQLNLPLQVLTAKTGLQQDSDEFCRNDLKLLSSEDIPVSLTLLKHETQGTRLVLRLSHAQYDGISFPIILKSLMDGYNGIEHQVGPDFGKFLSYAHQNRERSIKHWTKVLDGSTLATPEAFIRPDIIAGSQPERILEQADIDLPQLPKKVTTATLMSAAWALLLARITGDRDIVFGHVVAGRNAAFPGIDELVGTCLNIVPLRVDLAGKGTLHQLLTSLVEQFVSFGDSDSLGFKDIIEYCTDWPAETNFESTIQHQNIDEHPEIESQESSSQVQFFENPDLVPPSLFMVSYPRATGVQIKLFGNTHVLSKVMAQSLLEDLCAFAEEIGKNPDRLVESVLEEKQTDG